MPLSTSGTGRHRPMSILSGPDWQAYSYRFQSRIGQGIKLPMGVVDFIIKDRAAVAIFVVGLTVWIVALWTIFRKSKFRRKWWWALLASVAFSFWPTDIPGLSVGIPLGSVFVLWFARFGPNPKQPLSTR